MDILNGYSETQIKMFARKELERREEEKNYSLFHIEKSLIEDLEDHKKEILETDGDYLHEFVDSSISVYYYDQVMIFAKNSADLWHLEDEFDAKDVNQYIVNIIHQHLSGVAHEWLNKVQQ
tara:strand:+ start:50 stop:412 length:363 start_codon:yes stop_codon:yes gene_type:complete